MPRPTISGPPPSSRTISVPTDGLVEVRPSFQPERRSAAAMKRRSRAVWSAASAAIAGPRLLLAAQLAEHLLEVLGLAEIAVDRGEADIGDVVERLQRFHDEAADLARGDLGFPRALELAHDAGHRALDPLGVDIAFARRDLDGAHQLVAVEGHLAAGLLQHDKVAQLHPLEGGEAAAADRADTPAADGRAVLGRPRILHLGVF